jgi:hypothetical protein
MIIKPLQKIQVLNSTKRYKAGSLGYFVFQSISKNCNRWNMYVVFTRFGKKGKPRIEPIVINTRIIDYNILENSDREIIDIVKLYEKLEPIKHSKASGDIEELEATEIEISPIDSKDVLNFSDNEFTAYLIALSILVFKTSRNFSMRKVSTFLLSSANKKRFIQNKFDLATVDPALMGYYIPYGIRYDSGNIHYLENIDIETTFEKSYNSQIDTKLKKQTLLNRLHRSFAMARKQLIDYHAQTEQSLASSSNHISEVLNYYRSHSEELLNIKNRMGAKRKLSTYKLENPITLNVGA